MSEHFRLLATNEKGRLIFDSPTHLQGVLSALPSRVMVTLERERQIRSTQANRYYFACVVPIAAEVLSVGRVVPLSKDQAHEILKQAFLGLEETPLGKVGKSTRGLSVAEFAAFVEKVQAWFTTEHGIAFPQPGEMDGDAA